MLVDSATMKAMKISRFERVGVQDTGQSSFFITSFSKGEMLPVSHYLLLFAASPQLGCVQGSDQGQEQVQRQEDRRGRILIFLFLLSTVIDYLSSCPAFFFF